MTLSLIDPRPKIPPKIDGSSIVLEAIFRTGPTTNCSNASAENFWPASEVQFIASTPAVIEPPDTLEMRSSFSRYFESFRYQSVPRWKSIARYPPPERQTARVSSTRSGSGLEVNGSTAGSGISPSMEAVTDVGGTKYITPCVDPAVLPLT